MYQLQRIIAGENPSAPSDRSASASPSRSTTTRLPFGDLLTNTGTISISTISATTEGRVVSLLFATALTTTHDASLVLKGAVNATVASGNITLFYNGSGNWPAVSRDF